MPSVVTSGRGASSAIGDTCHRANLLDRCVKDQWDADILPKNLDHCILVASVS